MNYGTTIDCRLFHKDGLRALLEKERKGKKRKEEKGSGKEGVSGRRGRKWKNRKEGQQQEEEAKEGSLTFLERKTKETILTDVTLRNGDQPPKILASSLSPKGRHPPIEVGLLSKLYSLRVPFSEVNLHLGSHLSHLVVVVI